MGKSARGYTKGRREAVGAVAVVCAVYAGLCSLGIDGCSVTQREVGTQTCLACHDGLLAPDKRAFIEGPHYLNDVGCEACHGAGFDHARIGGRGGLFIAALNDLPFEETHVACQSCHPSPTKGFLESGHAAKGAVRCTDCHTVHEASTLTALEETNALCLQCHEALEFPDDQAVDFHTGPMHPVDPAGTGASRCAPCHMTELEQRRPRGGPRGHSLRVVSPKEVLAAAAMGVTPLPPSSCAGAAGCHDPDFPDFGPPRNPNDLQLLEGLQFDFMQVGKIP